MSVNKQVMDYPYSELDTMRRDREFDKLFQVLESGTPANRETAANFIVWITEKDNEQNIKKLSKALEKEEDERVKSAIKRGLEEFSVKVEDKVDYNPADEEPKRKREAEIVEEKPVGSPKKARAKKTEEE